MIAKTPEPPYYAVIFTSIQTEDTRGYAATADHMVELAVRQPGFLGSESAREALGITVSYWSSLAAIRAWKADTDHLLAQQQGREQWYRAYHVRIALIERAYDFASLPASDPIAE